MKVPNKRELQQIALSHSSERKAKSEIVDEIERIEEEKKA